MTTMETAKQAPQSPGSYADFLTANPDLSQGKAATIYYDSLDEYRGELANYYGVSREELHDMSFRRVGSIPTQVSVEI